MQVRYIIFNFLVTPFKKYKKGWGEIIFNIIFNLKISYSQSKMNRESLHLFKLFFTKFQNFDVNFILIAHLSLD